MKELIIVGAGNCGREVLQWALDINKIKKEWEIKGFINDIPDSLNGKKTNYKIIGTIKDWVPSKNEVFVCAIADCKGRKKVVTSLKERGAEFITLIHHTSIVADTAEICEGAIIYPFSVVSDNAKVGKFCILNLHTAIGHDALLGDFTTLSSFCDITGGVRVGNEVFMGSHVSIVPNITIGDEAVVCAGSIVVSNVKPSAKVFGNPAKKLTL